MQPRAQEKDVKKVPPFTSCGGKNNGAQGGQSTLLNRTLGKTT